MKPKLHLVLSENACTLFTALLAAGHTSSFDFKAHETITSLNALIWTGDRRDADILVIDDAWMDDPGNHVRNSEGRFPMQDILALLQAVVIHEPNLKPNNAFDPPVPITFNGAVLFLTSRLIDVTQLDRLSNVILGIVETPTHARHFLLHVTALWQRLTSHQAQQAEIKKRTQVMLEQLAKAIEQRDKFTGSHVNRVSKLSRRLAELYIEAYPNEKKFDLDQFELAAALHDIGKIGTPECILSKPGILDADERSIMKRHAAKGWELLKDTKVDVMDMAAEIARSHHEKFNGKGYPLGTGGACIPLTGRIVAIVDVMDALLSKRPYKSAQEPDQALATLNKDQSECTFDPVVFKLMLDHWDHLVELYQQISREEENASRTSGRQPA